MTSTTAITRPQAPRALGINDSLRRPNRPAAPTLTNGGTRVKTGSTRYTTLERQDLAADYYANRQAAKYRRAYTAMSPFMLQKLIERLENGLAQDTGSRHIWNTFRLTVARKARDEQAKAGFRLPTLKDIPFDAPTKLLKEFLTASIALMESKLTATGDMAERNVLRKQLDSFKMVLETTVGTKPNGNNTASPKTRRGGKKRKKAANKA